MSETAEPLLAKCGKCGKEINDSAQTDNWAQFHGSCLSLQEILALADKPKSKSQN